MRDMKFRVWDSNGKMHYLGMEETDDALLFRSNQHFDGDLTVMQCTEEIDSNGRNIYEGDIIRYRPKKKYFSAKLEFFVPIFSAELSMTNEKETECIVKFEFGSFVLAKEDDNKYIELLHSALSEDENQEFEVIGNIYEGKFLNGVDEWCAHCGAETLLPYIEDATSLDQFKCSDCGRFLEPDAQKEEPYPPVKELMRGMNDDEEKTSV